MQLARESVKRAVPLAVDATKPDLVALFFLSKRLEYKTPCKDLANRNCACGRVNNSSSCQSKSCACSSLEPRQKGGVWFLPSFRPQRLTQISYIDSLASTSKINESPGDPAWVRGVAPYPDGCKPEGLTLDPKICRSNKKMSHPNFAKANPIGTEGQNRCCTISQIGS